MCKLCILSELKRNSFFCFLFIHYFLEILTLSFILMQGHRFYATVAVDMFSRMEHSSVKMLDLFTQPLPSFNRTFAPYVCDMRKDN